MSVKQSLAHSRVRLTFGFGPSHRHSKYQSARRRLAVLQQVIDWCGIMAAEFQSELISPLGFFLEFLHRPPQLIAP